MLRRELVLLALGLALTGHGCAVNPEPSPTAEPDEPATSHPTRLSLRMRMSPSDRFDSWTLRSAAGLELGAGELDAAPVELELPSTDLYVLELRTETRVVELPLPMWRGDAELELTAELDRDPPRWTGSAVDPLWRDAWAISQAWQDQVMEVYAAEADAGLLALAERSRAEIAEHPAELQALLQFRWFAVFSSLIPDPGSVFELAALAEPDSPAWAALELRLAALLRKQQPSPELVALLERLAEHPSSASVRAVARHALLVEAARVGDRDAVTARWNALDLPEYRGTEPHRWAAADYDPKHPLAPGQSLELRVRELGDPARVREISGPRERPLLLVLWSIGCHFCRDELPQWQRVHEEYGERLDLLAVNVDGDPAAVDAYLAGNPLAWDHAQLDPAEFELLRERWRITGVPSLVLIDERGAVILAGKRLRGPNLRPALAELLD